jgi:hypothetical protein
MYSGEVFLAIFAVCLMIALLGGLAGGAITSLLWPPSRIRMVASCIGGIAGIISVFPLYDAMREALDLPRYQALPQNVTVSLHAGGAFLGGLILAVIVEWFRRDFRNRSIQGMGVLLLLCALTAFFINRWGENLMFATIWGLPGLVFLASPRHLLARYLGIYLLLFSFFVGYLFIFVDRVTDLPALFGTIALFAVPGMALLVLDRVMSARRRNNSKKDVIPEA